MGTWATENFKQYNLDIVPYVVPAVSEADASKDHHIIATIDFGGIITSCEHPREAYELLKFMSFGADGWLTRVEMYNDETITNTAGLPLKYDVMPCPITTDEKVWSAYTDMYCKGMDEEHRACWEEFFASCMQPIPFGWTSIAGYWNYCDEYFNSIGIHDLVDKGRAKAAEYADEATSKANLYHAQAMLDYFGPDGYDLKGGTLMKKGLAIVLSLIMLLSVCSFASAEALPEAFAHITFDGGDEGYRALVRVDDTGDNDGANFGIAPSAEIAFRYGEGPVGKALFLDGTFGIDLGIAPTNTDTWTVSFWVNASRLSDYGPTLQIGYNMAGTVSPPT